MYLYMTLTGEELTDINNLERATKTLYIASTIATVAILDTKNPEQGRMFSSKHFSEAITP